MPLFSSDISQAVGGRPPPTVIPVEAFSGRFVASFWARVDKSGSCWLWTGKRDPKGYGRLQKNRKSFGAHRFAWELEAGPIEAALDVLHRCDVPSCVKYSHLFLGTNEDNHRDKILKGRQARGEMKALKLTEADVRQIRLDFAAGRKQLELAEQYGLCQPTVSEIVNFRKWKHVL